MMSQRVDKTWIRRGGYGRFRGEWVKANNCLVVLRSLWKEGFGQGEVDCLFSAMVLPNFTYVCLFMVL